MITEAVGKLMEGLILIELENIDLFTEKSFSEFSLIKHPTNATLMFTIVKNYLII